MKAKLIVLLSLSLTAEASANGFCVVRGYGSPDCQYTSAEYCQRIAASVNGQCVVNPATFSNQQTPNHFESYMKGREAGERARQAREAEARASEARAKQWEYWSSQVKADANQNRAPRVLYWCRTSDGQSFETTTPMVGCVVTKIE